MVRVENAAIVVGFFGSEIGGEHAVGAHFGRGGGKLFEAHLQDRVVVAEQDEGNLTGLANTVDEVEDPRRELCRISGRVRRRAESWGRRREDH